LVKRGVASYAAVYPIVKEIQVKSTKIHHRTRRSITTQTPPGILAANQAFSDAAGLPRSMIAS